MNDIFNSAKLLAEAEQVPYIVYWYDNEHNYVLAEAYRYQKHGVVIKVVYPDEYEHPNTIKGTLEGKKAW